jgi:hypothetical protein
LSKIGKLHPRSNSRKSTGIILAAKEVSARIDLLQAVLFIADSWRRVITKAILNLQHCFAHSCFKHSGFEMLNKADSENDMLEMHHVRKYKEFSCIDNSLQCYNEN